MVVIWLRSQSNALILMMNLVIIGWLILVLILVLYLLLLYKLAMIIAILVESLLITDHIILVRLSEKIQSLKHESFKNVFSFSRLLKICLQLAVANLSISIFLL